jgi:hypothetical protein
LATTADTILTGEAADDRFGWSVATAGDVNGDGYADVVVGAYWYGNLTGRAYVYLGGTSGLATTAATTLTGEADSDFGWSVATAGDVNGDGYADVVVGAYLYSVSTGRAYVYAGNGMLGRSLAPRTRRADDSGPVAYGGRSDSLTGFRLAALGHSPFGRTRVKLEWEVKPLSTAFNGNGTGRSATWHDTTTVGASLNELASGLTRGTPYHWRVRVRYHPTGSPFAQSSRWVTQPWVGAQETRLRTKPNSAPTATALSITGTLRVGQVLTGHYTYGDVDGDAEGASTFRWLCGGGPISGATALTYSTVAADSGQTLTFEVTPRALTGTVIGTPVVSGGVLITNTPTFEDDPLAAGSTLVKVVHVTELRQRIDDLRARYALGAFAWTDATIVAGVTPVKAIHLTELRTALNEVYRAAGQTPPTYTHATITGRATVITAVDIAELRAAVLAVW